MSEWQKKYKVKIVIEQREMRRHSKEKSNLPIIKHNYVTSDREDKPIFCGPDKAMLLAYGFLFDKLQGFSKWF